MAKQAALAFVKRTLERCHKFEDMGKSCFGEPLFRDMFLSASGHLSDSQSVDTPTDGESAKLYASASSRSLEARVSGILSDTSGVCFCIPCICGCMFFKFLGGILWPAMICSFCSTFLLLYF